MKKMTILLLGIILPVLSSCTDRNENTVTIVKKPDMVTTNDFYISNRSPLEGSPFIKLPVGAIKPEGWLKKELELQANGFHGHLEEISQYLIKENNAWLDPQGKGDHGWEEMPYWLKGYSNCAYVLGNKKMIKEAEGWLKPVIRNQREDGWFGPEHKKSGIATHLRGRADLWPNMVMLTCLQNYYEYAGNDSVLSLMSKYFKYLQTYPDDKFLVGFWPKMRAGDMLYSVYWLYNRTGEKWLLNFAEKVHRNTARWDTGIVSWHNVNIAQAFGEPATYWMQSKKTADLQAAERNWQTVRRIYGQVPGGLFGGDENCRPGFTGPRQAIETCGIVEDMFSDEVLIRITGDPVWADRCENDAFNTLPAAFTPDMKALRYLTAPNMPQSDSMSKCPGIDNCGPMFWMNPHIHRCCQHNSGQGWPYYAENLWYATPDNGLAVIFYSESNVTAKTGKGVNVKISEQTHYPFDEQIVLTITPDTTVKFPLYLRIPGWCTDAGLTINGEKITLHTQPGSYIKIVRTFHKDDRITLNLPMTLKITRYTQNKNSISVNYGPLTLSLKIDEKYIRNGGTEKWPAWEIFPGSAWNYGLVLDDQNPGKSFEIIKKEWPVSNMPFTQDNTPIVIKSRAKQIPEWKLNAQGLAEKLPLSPVQTNKPAETVTFIPMGAARLRISAFPVCAK
ncbi:MAG: hypothetical protein GXO83_11225 [Chlorobi bacterium]|nr:hypothetical protein [Chlorobiota bacterium]